MNIYKSSILMFAVAAGAAAGAALATRVHHRRRRIAHDHDDRTELKSWENEGGNLAPAVGSAVQS